MFKKLVNTLKYGSGKTRLKLWLIIGGIAIGVTGMLFALAFGIFLLGFVSFFMLFIGGLMLINTSFEEKTVSVKHKEKKVTKKKEKKNITESEETKEEEEAGALEWISSEKKESPLADYDEKKLKKLFVAYKVKKHHVPVMIDMCQAERIVQSPAYMWNDANYLYFLVLAEEPRLIKSNLSESNTIYIRRGTMAHPMEEYPEMNEKSVISMVFGGLLPKYYKKESSPYRTEFRKNLYSAAPGIWCTSGSVKNMLKLLPARFVLEDGKTDEESIYYQEIYIARVMYWDGIYSGQEYKEKVLSILAELIRAELAESTVKEYLNAMMQKGLIPREYAEYVLSKRKVK